MKEWLPGTIRSPASLVTAIGKPRNPRLSEFNETQTRRNRRFPVKVCGIEYRLSGGGDDIRSQVLIDGAKVGFTNHLAVQTATCNEVARHLKLILDDQRQLCTRVDISHSESSIAPWLSQSNSISPHETSVLATSPRQSQFSPVPVLFHHSRLPVAAAGRRQCSLCSPLGFKLPSQAILVLTPPSLSSVPSPLIPLSSVPSPLTVLSTRSSHCPQYPVLSLSSVPSPLTVLSTQSSHCPQYPVLSLSSVPSPLTVLSTQSSQPTVLSTQSSHPTVFSTQSSRCPQYPVLSLSSVPSPLSPTVPSTQSSHCSQYPVLSLSSVPSILASRSSVPSPPVVLNTQSSHLSLSSSALSSVVAQSSLSSISDIIFSISGTSTCRADRRVGL